MFTTLIASGSQTKRKTWTPATVFVSLVFHGLLLVGAVYASVQAPEEEVKEEEEVTFMEVEEEEPPPPEVEVEPPPAGFQELIPPLVPPPSIPLPDASAPAINLADFSGIGVSGGIGNAAPVVVVDTVREASFAYEVAVLDNRPSLSNTAAVTAAMQRAYPRILLDAGISGTVTMQFVIEPDGSVDLGSVKVVSASNERFESASREVVERFRFTPGRYKGNPVRVLIEMPITWQAE